MNATTTTQAAATLPEFPVRLRAISRTMYTLYYPVNASGTVRAKEVVWARDYKDAVRQVAATAPMGWSGVKCFGPAGRCY